MKLKEMTRLHQMLGNDTNLIGVGGASLNCHICQSIKHFAARCPHGKSAEEAQMAIIITLLSGKGDGE